MDETCVIIVQNKEFVVDKQLLCSSIDYFQTMFQSQMVESQSNEVVLNDVSSDAFEIILEYIETNIIPHELDEDLLINLIRSSHMLMLNDLYEKCCRRIQVTESNYSKMLALSFLYQNDSLKKSIAEFQAKNFHGLKKDLLLLPSDSVDFLLSNTTIDVTVNEIVDFLLEWGKINEDVSHLPRIIPRVNMSSMTEDSLDDYLTKKSLITSNRDVYNAFMETASLGHIHFMCIADTELRTYSIRNNEWDVPKILPKQCFYASNRLYYIDNDFYAFNSISSTKMEVLKLNKDGIGIASSKKIHADSRAQILLIEKLLYIISCDMDFQRSSTRSPPTFSMVIHTYDIATERFKMFADKQNISTGTVFSVTASNTDLYLLVPNSIYQLNLGSCEWKELSLPVPFNYDVSESIYFMGFYDQLYFFYLKKRSHVLTSNQSNSDEDDAHNKTHKCVEVAGQTFLCINKLSEIDQVHDMTIFKLASNDTWIEYFVYREFPYRDVQPLYPPIAKNRRLPIMLFAAWNSTSYLQYDFRTNEWKQVPVDALYNWQSLIGLNYICKKEGNFKPKLQIAKCKIS